MDIQWYTSKANIVEIVEKKNKLVIPKNSFYPFHLRPFGPLWLLAPREPSVFLRRKYKQFKCRSGHWNHRNERGQPGRQANCQHLKSYYPFVKRRKYGNMTKESLMLNGSLLYDICVNEKNLEDQVVASNIDKHVRNRAPVDHKISIR